MNEKSDTQLLRDYARRGSEAAFREIVTRHTDFVYSAALRQVDSSDLAADIAQQIFVDLARRAKPLGDRLAAEASLAGWLHRATRYAALNHLRDTRRRLANERQAMEQLLTNSESPADWEQIRPALDEALDSLGDEDREALLLRYFKNQDFRAVGFALGISDDAAQKRVSRAVEKLREFFSKQKITIGASGLAVLISANAVQSSPVGLAAAISTAAVFAGTTTATSTAIAATKTIAMTTLQKTIIGAALATAVGTGVFEAHQASQFRDQVQTFQQQQAPLDEQIRQLQRERDDATNRVAGMLAENAQLKSNSNESELLRLRGEVGVLRAQLAQNKAAGTTIEQPSLSSAREYYNRAMNHSMNHEYAAELEDLNKAIEMEPNMAEAYTARGNLYAFQLPKEKGGFETAVTDYTRCLEIKPNDSSARWNRAILYSNLRKYNEAIADWTIYINGDTDFSNQLDGKTKSIAGAHFQRGRIYQTPLHDYAKAIADYTAAIQLNPNIEDAHRLRGQCYESLGDTEKAQQDFAIEPKRN
ncbi:MAG TPA: sigma-70 family RNA polymerase sigma factor [Verrucomicrobiae bacterium]|nr:sigma-70 family RNA polymerase sigma factor [Verrucomicrobiae bacterium]